MERPSYPLKLEKEVQKLLPKLNKKSEKNARKEATKAETETEVRKALKLLHTLNYQDMIKKLKQLLN